MMRYDERMLLHPLGCGRQIHFNKEHSSPFSRAFRLRGFALGQRVNLASKVKRPAVMYLISSSELVFTKHGVRAFDAVINVRETVMA